VRAGGLCSVYGIRTSRRRPFTPGEWIALALLPCGLDVSSLSGNRTGGRITSRGGLGASDKARANADVARPTLTTRKHDAMTASSQIIECLYNEELPPVTFRVDISVMAVRISGSNPSRMGARRLFPPARLPTVGFTIPAVVPANPDMIPAWTSGTMLPDANRWPKLYYDLRPSGDYPNSKAKQRSKNQVSHFLSCGYMCNCMAVHGFSLFNNMRA
jgi:hypothetical protein